GTGTGTGTGTTSGTTPVNVNVHVDNTIDWGSNPDTAAPELTPDEPKSFIEPLWNMWPAVRDFSVASRVASCPVASFELWGQKFVMDAQCKLLDKPDVRKTISAFMLLIYALIALRVILEA
ncbi:hypothetical protein JYY64_004649, partial [Salmonella enterica subsp. houtenae serovar 50:g,z51:-]|nr:hypothetical protein [Salmonella enterica subsp. houtenae serovar 50:g,z51:-]